MALTMTRGFTFGPNEVVTADKLHQLIDNATGANLDRTNMAAGFYGVTASSIQPSGIQTGELWWDFNEDILKTFDGAIIRSVGSQVEVSLTYRDPGALASVTPGMVVILDTGTDESCTTTTIAGNERAVGINIEDTPAGSVCRVATSGIVRNVRVDSFVNRGDYLTTSTTLGLLTGDASRVPGAIGQALRDSSGAPETTDMLVQGQPVSAVTQNSIILWDQGSTCPAGFTEVAALQDGYPRGASAGGAPIAVLDTGGKNDYDAFNFAGSVARSSDVDGVGPYDGIPLITANVAQWNGVGPGGGPILFVEGAQPREGDHNHRLDGLTNEPGFYAVLFCKKD